MNSGTVTVGTTPTLICTSDFLTGVVIQNSGDATVFLGGSTVAASGTAAGVSLAAGSTLAIPALIEGLFAVVASGTGTVAFLAGN
jgi:hypothetical protein